MKRLKGIIAATFLAAVCSGCGGAEKKQPLPDSNPPSTDIFDKSKEPGAKNSSGPQAG